MDILQFIGFIVLMIASVILSVKRSKEKRESLDRFEQEERDEESDEEEKIEPVHRLVKKAEAPQLSAVPKITLEKDFLKKDTIFDMHKGAFGKKAEQKPGPLQKLGNIQDAIIIQTILNKPKGW